MDTRNWLAEVDGVVTRVLGAVEVGPGDADLAFNMAGRQKPGSRVGRVWPENDGEWFGLVYPGQVMPYLMPAGVAGYTVEHRTEAFEVVSRVYWGRECVGTFYTRGQDVSVGKFRLTARSPVKAMLGIIDEHQKGQRLIQRQAAAFGVPA